MVVVVDAWARKKSDEIEAIVATTLLSSGATKTEVIKTAAEQ